MTNAQRKRVAWFKWAALVIAVGCSGHNMPVTAPPHEHDLITHEELAGSIHAELDLQRAIQALRPQFLLPPLGVQRATAPRAVLVYVDGIRQPAGPEVLRTIRASSVEEVRYLDPTAASNQLGPLAAGGALMIKLSATQRPVPPESIH